MHPNQCAARVGYDLGRQLIDKDHSSTWSTTSPATPSTLALLPASAAGYFQALYHTDDGLLKALHHVPAYLLEFSSNHWISPSPSASTQCSSSPSTTLDISKTELPEGCSQVSSTQPISQGHLCLLHLQVSASGAKNSSFQPLSKSASRAKSHRPSFGCHQRISTPELPQWPILLFMALRTRRIVPRPRRLPKIGQI